MSAKKPQLNGRQRSVTCAVSSKKTDAEKKLLVLEKRLSDAFAFFAMDEKSADSSRDKHDFVFHMTDWISDLEELAALYKDPDAFDRKHARQLIFGFLVHAVGHLNAASRLLLGEVCDPFLKKK